ncbi:hypothetical protein HQN88_16740 [Paenibacillus qinlingensis]|nr:hypothetical protein [Paenibacillus qinlingensis]
MKRKAARKWKSAKSPGPLGLFATPFFGAGERFRKDEDADENRSLL